MINIDLKPVKEEKTKLYKVIVNKIISMIYCGELNYGDKLYKESDLIEMLNVSRASLREALRVLEFMNIITVNPKLGIRVEDPSNFTDFPPLRSLLEFENIHPWELMKLRKSLEFISVETIIENFDEEKKIQLTKLLEKFDSTTESEKLFEIDANMHSEIIRMSNNSIAFKMYNTFLVYMLKYGIEYSSDIYKGSEKQHQLDVHKNLLKSILKQDLQESTKYLDIIFEDIASKIKSAE